MNKKTITQLAYMYLDQPEHPDWGGLSNALLRTGCNLYEVQDILMSIRNGDY